jgi:hypothetical protein
LKLRPSSLAPQPTLSFAAMARVIGYITGMRP